MNYGYNKTTYRSRILIVIIPKLEKCLIYGISYMENHEPKESTIRALLLNEKKFDLFKAQIDNYNILPIEIQKLELKYRQMKLIWLKEYEKIL